MADILYEHYKGGKYRLIGVAKHTETGESLVVYESLTYNSMWVRPAAMFEENVVVDGVEVPRFKRICQSE
jgi:hypothetical protein